MLFGWWPRSTRSLRQGTFSASQRGGASSHGRSGSMQPASANHLSAQLPIGSSSLTSMAWMSREDAGASAFGLTQKLRIVD